MKFKKVELSDFFDLQKMLSAYDGRLCDCSPANLVMWRGYYDISVWQEGEDYAIRFGEMDGVACYYCPARQTVVDRLQKEIGGELIITCLCEEEVAWYEAHYACTQPIHDRDWDDYLYMAEDIIRLSGRRYSGQRNHINKFRANYPNAKWESITQENAKTVIPFIRGYFHEFGREDAEVASYEEAQLIEQMQNWEGYGQKGGMLTVNGEIVGFSVGEIVGDTLIVHTEKANTAYLGVYPALVQAFAQAYATECAYINREEDCGVAGLRTSKLSYHPIEIRKKYYLTIKGE